MIGQVLLEGFGLGVLLMLVCIPGYLAYVLVFCLPSMLNNTMGFLRVLSASNKATRHTL